MAVGIFRLKILAFRDIGVRFCEDRYTKLK